MFTHLDLFAGIGGFSRAVSWLGGTTVAFVEWESWNRRVLAKHWPHARFFGDIHGVTTDDLHGLGPIDLITGGYPCQPFSVAGRRLGADDPRHLWPEMRRAIHAVRPRYVLAENVDGHVTKGLDRVLAELEADGYACGAVVVPAGGVSALHKRNRVWIMAADADDRLGNESVGEVRAGRDAAHSLRRVPSVAESHPRMEQPSPEQAERNGRARGSRMGHHVGGSGLDQRAPESGVADTHGAGQREHGGAEPVPTQHATAERSGGERTRPEVARTMGAGADGVRPGLVRRPAPGPADIEAMWLDGSWEHNLPRVVAEEPERRQRIQGAGNAIVPLVAYEILSVMLGAAND